jgi:hypothetical protein
MTWLCSEIKHWILAFHFILPARYFGLFVLFDKQAFFVILIASLLFRKGYKGG